MEINIGPIINRQIMESRLDCIADPLTVERINKTNLDTFLAPLTTAPETDDAALAFIEQLATSLAPESLHDLKTALLTMYGCRRVLGRPVSGAYDDVLGFFMQSILANPGAD